MVEAIKIAASVAASATNSPELLSVQQNGEFFSERSQPLIKILYEYGSDKIVYFKGSANSLDTFLSSIGILAADTLLVAFPVNRDLLFRKPESGWITVGPSQIAVLPLGPSGRRCLTCAPLMETMEQFLVVTRHETKSYDLAMRDLYMVFDAQLGKLAIARRLISGLFEESARAETTGLQPVSQEIFRLIRDAIYASTRPEPTADYPSNSHLSRILACIKRQFAIPGLRISRVAEECNLSTRYVNSLMRRVNTTFGEYLREQRLQKIHQWLGEEAFAHTKISDLALMAGFQNTSHFNHAYRKRFGVSPLATRRLRRVEVKMTVIPKNTDASTAPVETSL